MDKFNYLFSSPINYEENLLTERKSKVRYWTSQGKAEFIRDFIALANTARMLGQPAYLLLGVRNTLDSSDQDICGIGEMYDRQVQNGLSSINAFEVIRRELSAIIQRYIEPKPIFEIRFTQIEDKVIGYILIQPLTGRPFHSREFREGGHTYLYNGQCWLRFGESKNEISTQELDPEGDRLRYCYSEVPYVLPSVWERFFTKLQEKILLLWREKVNPPPEEAYQELHDLGGKPLSDIKEEFLNQEDKRLLVVRGQAGCGKSLWLQRLVYSIAQFGQQEMQIYRLSEVFQPPKDWIPLLFQLSNLSRKAQSESSRFLKRLCQCLSVLWESNSAARPPSHPEILFNTPSLKWLILLDGLDEIGQSRQRREFLQVLLEFMETFPRVRVILSTRPVLPLEGVEWMKVVDVAPLNERQVESYFAAYRTDRNDTDIYAFIQTCKQWKDLWELLSAPVYLNAAVTSLGIPKTITNVEEEETSIKDTEEVIQTREIDHFAIDQGDFPSIPLEESTLEVEAPFTQESTQRLEEQEDEIVITLPRVLDRVYNEFWQREQSRNILPSLQEVRCSTHKLAANMTSCPSCVTRQTARRYLTSQGLRWTIEMGILTDNEYDHIFFAVPSTQIYSAVKQLKGDIDGGFFDCIYRYIGRWQQEYRSAIELFYQDLTGKSLLDALNT